MARKYRTYGLELLNPEKFTGGGTSLILKSSWELEFAKHCDLLPSVLSWNYEMVKIPYRDPITNKQKIYIPDFFVEIARKDGYSQHYVFEIKPMSEQLQEHARSQADSALVARNRAKWAAATMWADRHSAIFEVLNENDIYGWHQNRKPRLNAIKTYSPTHATKPMTTPTRSITARKRKVSAGVSKMQKRISNARRARSSRAGRVARA